MQKDKNKSSEKNRKIQTTTAIEEIAQILYAAIKRYVALPAAVKNIWIYPHRDWIYLCISALYIATNKRKGKSCKINRQKIQLDASFWHWHRWTKRNSFQNGKTSSGQLRRSTWIWSSFIPMSDIGICMYLQYSFNNKIASVLTEIRRNIQVSGRKTVPESFLPDPLLPHGGIFSIL